MILVKTEKPEFIASYRFSFGFVHSEKVTPADYGGENENKTEGLGRVVSPFHSVKQSVKYVFFL